jgi:hypothetical protein
MALIRSERRFVAEAHREAQRSFDQTITTLASSALVLSVTFTGT